ncbi:hypothetical protein [Aurantimonas sp. VKM B-3413]|uniref:hypothetical protein n=1 Tax=Aurantimonas sp. VKM B-3413 TaxID=2779401 RepID=UPI001E658F10|nr:hypothetical protein [Aurantimonas sp. VKM B-3413]MCB8835833.1 hypothetical protein [Aurantimonas sp. VKM B-3413]
MTNRISTLAGASAILLSLAAVPAVAQDNATPKMNDVKSWDADANGSVSQDEFNAGFDQNGAYKAWDKDGDGALSQEEFDTGVFGAYDRDNSGTIEEPEFGDVGDDIGDGGFWDV